MGIINSRPLSIVPPGQKVKVVYTDSYDEGMIQRLSDMGLNEGSEVEIIRPGCPGPFLIAIRDTRLAIGEEIANQIIVC